MKTKIISYISTWERRDYQAGIPDEADAKLEASGIAPSYRHICKAILKNDVALKSLGFSRQKTDSYSMLKKIEIEARNNKNERIRSIPKKTKNDIQRV